MRMLAIPALGAILTVYLAAEPQTCVGEPHQQNDGRNARWLAAIEFLKDELPGRHIDPFFRLPESEFNERLNAIKSDVPRLEDYEIVVALMGVVASIGDSHTHLNADQTGIFHRLPIKMEWFTDGLFITGTSDEHVAILGRRVTGIEGLTIDEVNERIKTVVSNENDAQLRSDGPGAMMVPEILAALGISGSIDSVIFNLQGAGDVVISPREMWEAPETRLLDSLSCRLPLYLQHPDSIYWYRYIEDRGAIYIRYRSCRQIEGRPFADLVDEALRVMDSNHVEKFIFDVRSNGGGNSSIARPLVSEVRARAGINREGGVFVLIDRGTYSSALLNAIDFKNDTEVVLIGEPTGGKPDHYGEVRFFTLPNTMIVVTYSTKHFRTYGSDAPSLNPDVAAGLSFEDFLACRDPALEAALNWSGAGGD
jgi:hypothetical protein